LIGYPVFVRREPPLDRPILTTARALGEFGAVAVVSGKTEGQTETMTLFVEQRFQAFDLTGAYAAFVVLALLALVVIGTMTLLDRRKASGPSSNPLTLGSAADHRRSVMGPKAHSFAASLPASASSSSTTPPSST